MQRSASRGRLPLSTSASTPGLGAGGGGSASGVFTSPTSPPPASRAGMPSPGYGGVHTGSNSGSVLAQGDVPASVSSPALPRGVGGALLPSVIPHAASRYFAPPATASSPHRMPPAQHASTRSSGTLPSVSSPYATPARLRPRSSGRGNATTSKLAAAAAERAQLQAATALIANAEVLTPEQRGRQSNSSAASAHEGEGGGGVEPGRSSTARSKTPGGRVRRGIIVSAADERAFPPAANNTLMYPTLTAAGSGEAGDATGGAVSSSLFRSPSQKGVSNASIWQAMSSSATPAGASAGASAGGVGYDMFSPTHSKGSSRPGTSAVGEQSGGPSPALLHKAVFGDTRTRAMAAELLRVSGQLDARLQSIQHSSEVAAAGAPAPAPPADTSLTASMARCDAYVMALRSVSSSTAVARTLQTTFAAFLDSLTSRLEAEVGFLKSAMEAPSAQTAADAAAAAAGAAREPRMTVMSLSPLSQPSMTSPVGTVVRSPLAAGSPTRNIGVAPAADNVVLRPAPTVATAAAVPHLPPSSGTNGSGGAAATPQAVAHPVAPDASARSGRRPSTQSHRSGEHGGGVSEFDHAPSAREGGGLDLLDESDDSLAMWAIPGVPEDEEASKGDLIASVTREPSSAAKPPRAAGSSTAPHSGGTTGEKEVKKGIPSLGLRMGGGSSKPGDNTRAGGAGGGGLAMPPVESFQDEFMKNADTWSMSWRDEAADMKTTQMVVQEMLRQQPANGIPSEATRS